MVMTVMKEIEYKFRVVNLVLDCQKSVNAALSGLPPPFGIVIAAVIVKSYEITMLELARKHLLSLIK